MLHTLITIRHDTDWLAPIPVLTLAVAVTLWAIVDRWVNDGLPGLNTPFDDNTETAIDQALAVAASYDDRITAPFPPRPTGGHRR